MKVVKEKCDKKTVNRLQLFLFLPIPFICFSALCEFSAGEVVRGTRNVLNGYKHGILFEAFKISCLHGKQEEKVHLSKSLDCFLVNFSFSFDFRQTSNWSEQLDMR